MNNQNEASSSQQISPENDETATPAKHAAVDSDVDSEGSDDSSALWRAPATAAVAWLQQQIDSGACPRSLIRQLAPLMGEPSAPNDAALARAPDRRLWQFLLQLISDPPRRTKLTQYNTLEDAVELIRTRKNIIVLTGAGVSVSKHCYRHFLCTPPVHRVCPR